MQFRSWLRRRVLSVTLTIGVAISLVATGVYAFAGTTPLWKVELAKIPTTTYSRDALVYITEATQALRPYVGDDLGESRLEPVLADVDLRYFDGARFSSAADAQQAFDNLQHFESYLKGRLSGASPPNGEAELGHVTALVESLTGVRLLADAAVQDAEATIGPFRASPPPAPAPAGLTEAFADLAQAESKLAKVDEMLVKGNPEPAVVHAASAWEYGFNVLTRLGITYTGDHDNDGVVDVVELRFGASPLLVDSDGDELTDATEITQLVGWTFPNNADSDGDGVPDGQEDIDGDGLTNLQEQELGTRLTEPDTDGDGVNDGTEVANGTNPLVPDQPPPPVGGGADPIVPVPTDTDTDGDGLSDLEEGEILTDVNNVDSDGDGLSDGVEVDDWGTDPLAADTDGDGIQDGYEAAHAEDEGLDPGRPDQRISKWTYVADFLLGMFAGDFYPVDSMAWLAGNLCSGGLSAIPVVGWIIGGIADLRDTIAGLIRGDWVSAGLSILGVVPYVGDVVAIPGKAARFVLRFAHRIDEVLRFVTRYDKIPDSVKDIALELILAGTYTYLLGGDQSLIAAALPGRSRFSEADIRDLSRGDRTRWHNVESAMKEPLHVPGPAIAPQRSGAAGEAEFRRLMGGACLPGTTTIATPGFPRPSSTHRVPDCVENDPDIGLILHEVKTGVPNAPYLLDQCRKDAWILSPEGRAVHGQNVGAVHWHFIAHSRYKSIGIDPDLLGCLLENGIPFTIHAPTEA